MKNTIPLLSSYLKKEGKKAGVSPKEKALTPTVTWQL